MIRYTLRQLEAFLAVAEEESIAGASRRLGMSASAVTSALNEFERAMGTQLTIRRRAHGIVLTPAGVHVLVLTRDLLAQGADLQEAVGSPGQELRGRVSIGCYVSQAPTLLVDLMAEFSAAHPRVRVEFLAGSQTEVAAGVLEGHLDLGIAYDVLLPPELERTVLSTQTPMVIMAPDHPLAETEPLTLEQLAVADQVLLDISPSRENTLMMFSQHGLTPRIAHRTTDFEVTRSMAARGMGFAVLTQRPAADVSYAGEPLVVRQVTPDLEPVEVVLVSAPGRRLSRAAQAFHRFASR